MPILPIIDLLIVTGWTALMIGAVLKAVDITTRYTPSIVGFSSLDFAVMAGICFVFALTLAARTWVKLNEPNLLALRHRQDREEARRRVRAAAEAAEADEAAEELEMPRAVGLDRG